MLLAALLTLISPLTAQAATSHSAEGAKLAVCLELAGSDPSTAILTASTWLRESSGAEQALAHHCLGVAQASMGDWPLAERTFLTARDLTMPEDRRYRAALGAMAGNAAMAQDRNESALGHLDLALNSAADTAQAGEIQIDRAYALAALDRLDEADATLAIARRDASQNAEAWLLSATVSRVLERLDTAQSQIGTAAALAPFDPAVALEAGIIAALSGHDEAAGKSWRSAIDLAPDSLEAEAAQAYLEMLEGAGE